MAGPELSFGARLRQLRAAAGMSQPNLGKIINYHASLISKIENGVEAPPRQFAEACDRAFGADGALLALVAERPATPITPDDEERLRCSVETPSRVDAQVVESLAVMLAGQRTMEDSVGSASLLGPVTAQLVAIEKLVIGARGPIRSSVLDVAHQWAQFRGWLAAGTKRFPEASRFYDRALEWSAEVGDANMTATALNMKGHLAWLTGHVGPMLGLSVAAARQPASAGVLSLAVQQEARAHALVGDGDGCDRRLDQAVALATRAAEHSDDEPPWIYFYSADYLQLQRGLAYRYLGRTDQAITLLAGGLAALPAEMRRTEWVGWYVYRLALTHARAGDHATAEAVAADAADIADATGAKSLASKVTWLRQRLTR